MNKGFTLMEMVVVMVISIIMLVAIGAISDIGKRGYHKISDEAGIFNDITYGYKLIQNRVRKAALVDDVGTSTPWIGDKLITDNEAFGVYNEAGVSKDFVYLPDKDDPDDRRIILSVPDSDDMDMDVAHYSHPVKKVKITLSGTKYGVPFDMSTTVMPRI